MKDYLRTHRNLFVAIASAVVVLAVFVVVWFQPQKLFIEKTVDEALPAASKISGGSSRQETDAARRDAPTVLAAGAFSSLEHETTGSVKILELADGSRLLRFEELETSNGPDLRVYLSEIPASDDWHAYGERFVDLGALKGNLGNQNYEIPDDVDLSRYKSAVIWCRRFTVGFGVAGLS